MAKEWVKPFYSSAAWRYARQYALRRDMFTCQICGARASEVHHKTEISKDNINDPSVTLNPDNLQSLCHQCHALITMQEHGIKDIDCDVHYHFDSNGNLTPIEPTPLPVSAADGTRSPTDQPS